MVTISVPPIRLFYIDCTSNYNYGTAQDDGRRGTRGLASAASRWSEEKRGRISTLIVTNAIVNSDLAMFPAKGQWCAQDVKRSEMDLKFSECGPQWAKAQPCERLLSCFSSTELMSEHAIKRSALLHRWCVCVPKLKKQ